MCGINPVVLTGTLIPMLTTWNKQKRESEKHRENYFYEIDGLKRSSRTFLMNILVAVKKPQMNRIIDVMRLKQRHHLTKIYVDGANLEVIRELKTRIGSTMTTTDG
jgi:hypothetical protein